MLTLRFQLDVGVRLGYSEATRNKLIPHSRIGGVEGSRVAMTATGLRALNGWISAASWFGPTKQQIYDAVRLTETQKHEAEAALREYWNRATLECPLLLSIKPLHGFESRVMKDGFSPWQFEKWLIQGCDDAAIISCDRRGRPRLVVKGIEDFSPRVMTSSSRCVPTAMVGFTSTTSSLKGFRRCDRQKKQALSAIP